MNKYESIIIIGQNVEEEGINALISRFTDLINNHGKVSEVTQMGKRKLAYEIGIKKDSMFYLISKQNQNS